MERIATPNTLDIYNTLKPHKHIFEIYTPWLVVPTLSLTSHPELFDNTSSETLSIAYGGWSINSVNASNLQPIFSIAFFASLYAAAAKYKNRNLSFWENFTLEQLPSTTCTYLPALAVKQAFSVVTGRSFVDHTQRNERIAYVVMTVALSTFVMTRLYAKFKNDITPISNRGLTKYFTIQCIWHLMINEFLALTGEAMRRSIQSDPETWFNAVLNPKFKLTDPGYGLAKTLLESLTPGYLPEQATPHLAIYYLSSKPFFEETLRGQGVSDQAEQAFDTMEEKVKQKYPFLFMTSEQASLLEPATIDTLKNHFTKDKEEQILWSHFINKYHKDLTLLQKLHIYLCLYS